MTLPFPRRNLAAAVVLLALLAIPAFTAPARAADVPEGFFGLGGWSYPTDAQVAQFGGPGMGVVRASLGWNDVERQRGIRNWAHVDALVERARRGNFDVLFVLSGCAAWACGSVDAPPKDEPALSQYRNFVAEALHRYGTNGSYWGGGPHPRAMWQVGNEVNGGHYFGKNPKPSAYAAFLSAVGSTIRSIDGAATIVASGLVEKPGDSSGVPLSTFLADLYRQPGYASSFDVAAVHGYAEDPDGTMRVLDTMRRVTLEANDGARGLWVTEMGWATSGPLHAFRVDEATQAAYLRSSWDTLMSCRARWNLQKVMWFGYSDVAPAAIGMLDYWGVHVGLLRGDMSPKPAYAAFLEYLGGRLPAGRGEACGLPGGTRLDINDPDTVITQTPGVTRALTGPAVSFTSNEADARFECSMDGVEWWRACQAPHRVDSRREGLHWLRVRAIDAQGNPDPSPARADWMLDLSPPSTIITERTPRTSGESILKVAFTGRDAVGVASFECRLDGGAWSPCKSPYQSPNLKAGWHSIGIRAVDKAGHADPTPVSPNFKIDPSLRAGTKSTKSPKARCAPKKGKGGAKTKKRRAGCAKKKKAARKRPRKRS